MPRYFVEVAYKGAGYSGFQKQENAVTIQAEVEKALQIVFQTDFHLTGSSRTDSGVNALQNYFHFDTDSLLNSKRTYNLNAVLPDDIAVTRLYKVEDNSHCRFDAVYREYHYHIYFKKDPFWRESAYHFPFPLAVEKMEIAAEMVLKNRYFYAFSKRNTQVKTFECTIYESSWEQSENHLIYKVKANRFLRGMVRGLVGTMLQLGRNKIRLEDFQELLCGKNGLQADFSPPGKGLTLVKIGFKQQEQ